MFNFKGIPFLDIDDEEQEERTEIATSLSERQLHKRSHSITFLDCDKAVKACPAPKKEFWARDEKNPHLFLRMRESGAKTYYFRRGKTRSSHPWEPDEDARKEIIGTTEIYTLEEARKKADLMWRGGGLEFPFPRRSHRNTRIAEIFADFQQQFPPEQSAWFADRSMLIETHVLPVYGQHFLSGLSSVSWASIIDTVHLDNPNRALRLLKTLKSFLSWCVRDGYLRSNPLAKATISGISPPMGGTLTVPNLWDVYVAASSLSSPWDAIFRLIILTGLPLDVIRGIRAADIDWVQSVWHISNSANRRLGSNLTDQLKLTPLMLELLEPHRTASGFLFPSPRSPKSLMPINLSMEQLETLCTLSSLPRSWGIRELRRSVQLHQKSSEDLCDPHGRWEARLFSVKLERREWDSVTL